MSAAVSREKGFSMVEVLLAMMLLVVVVTALSGYHRALAARFTVFNQYRQLCTMPGTSLSSQQMFSRQAGRPVGGRQRSQDVSASRLHLFLLWVGAVS